MISSSTIFGLVPTFQISSRPASSTLGSGALPEPISSDCLAKSRLPEVTVASKNDLLCPALILYSTEAIPSIELGNVKS